MVDLDQSLTTEEAKAEAQRQVIRAIEDVIDDQVGIGEMLAGEFEGLDLNNDATYNAAVAAVFTEIVAICDKLRKEWSQ